MSRHRAFTWRWQIGQSDLDATTKLVAWGYSLWMNDAGECFVAHATVAKVCSSGESTVRKHAAILELAGWLERTKRPGRTDLVHATTPLPASGVPRHEVADPPLPRSAELGTELDRSSKSSTSQSARPARERDPLFDAVAVVCGFALTGLTRPEGRRIGTAVAHLKKVEATPEQVHERAERYVAMFGREIALTPSALVSNWSKLRSSREQRVDERVESQRRRRGES